MFKSKLAFGMICAGLLITGVGIGATIVRSGRQ